MLIENPEAFKAWMAKILEPMCDADPEALAKYIYALVKKDKPTEDLRKSTVAQLEVFLNKETKGFVDLMFQKLEVGFKDEPMTFKIKEEPVDKEQRVEPAGAIGESVCSLSTSIEDQLLGETDLSLAEQINPENIPIPSSEKPPAPVATDDRPTGVVPPAKDQQVQARVESPRLRNGSYETSQIKAPERERRLSSSRSDRRSDSEREGRGEPSRWRGSSMSPPVRGRGDRSRSRSWERRSSTRRSRSKSRRSRSRGKERDRSRAWRNKSPPPRSRYDRDRKMRSWSKSPPPRSRSRSPPSKMRSRYRNRSPAGRSRSRSHSYDSPHKSTPMSRGATPTLDGNLEDDMRLSQTMQSVVHSKKRRCRDFDEKGFCMRGEMCPYDHGADPVVLEDVGQVFSISAPGLPPPTLEPPAPSLVPPGIALHHRPQLMNRPPPNLAEYNPDAPSMEPRMWSKQPFRSAVGRGLVQRGGAIRAPLGFPHHHHHHQRELINVPVVEGEECPYFGNLPIGNPMKRHCPPEFSNDMESMPPTKQRFDYSRLGPRGRAGNCSLHLKKVPAGLNNIAHLHNHFYKFGKIVNIQISFEGDHEAALITFTSHAEASAAYKSTEAVLNNRFIKVFWYNPDKDLQNKQENISPLNRPSAKERLGAPVVNTAPPVKHIEQNNETEKVLISGSNITKTVYNNMPSTQKQVLPPPQPGRMIVTTAFNNTPATDMQATRNSIRKKQDEKRKEALKLTQHLCKRKYELIEKLLYHQKQLIEKLEKGNISPEQRAEILTTIKGFQENIDMIRKDIKTVVTKPATNNNNAVKVSPQLVKRTREETQKQILDAELDLFNHQQEGKDTSELQKRVLELKTKAHNLGLLANNGVLRLSRGGARFRSGRGRGGFNPHATVDHRPTKLLVSGFESDDKAEVLQHFTKFGEVADHVWDEATPALVIQFKTRKDAETAMAKGRNFQDRLLSVTWFSSAQNMGMRSSRSVILLNDSSMSDLLSEHDDEEEALRINLDQNEDFLLQDEEEEEDEDRSWRR